MGIYDSLAANKQAVGGGVGNGGSFAQKQKMQANPVMQGRPGMSTGAPMGMKPGMGTAPVNPMAQMQQINKSAGMQGSRQQIQAKQLAQEQAKAQAANPQAGIGPSEPVVKSGLPTLQTPYDMQQNPAAPPPQAQEQLQNPMRPQEPNPIEQQIMASKPDAVMGAVQNGGITGPMGTAMGQEVPQDPRQQQYNTWLNGGGGENPYATPEPQAEAAPQGIGGSGIENIMQRMGGTQNMQRPQVMPRRRR